jgi:hypothetical protein
MKSRWFTAILLSALCITQVAAQANPDLDKLAEKLTRHIESQMPGWSHKRVEPFMNSPSVLVEKWSFPN